MNAIGAGQRRQVGPIVDDAQRGRFPRQRPQQPRPTEQFPVGELLVAELNRLDAGLDQRNHQPLELFGRAAAIDEHIEPDLASRSMLPRVISTARSIV